MEHDTVYRTEREDVKQKLRDEIEVLRKQRELESTAEQKAKELAAEIKELKKQKLLKEIEQLKAIQKKKEHTEQLVKEIERLKQHNQNALISKQLGKRSSSDKYKESSADSSNKRMRTDNEKPARKKTTPRRASPNRHLIDAHNASEKKLINMLQEHCLEQPELEVVLEDMSQPAIYNEIKLILAAPEKLPFSYRTILSSTEVTASLEDALKKNRQVNVLKFLAFICSEIMRVMPEFAKEFTTYLFTRHEWLLKQFLVVSECSAIIQKLVIVSMLCPETHLLLSKLLYKCVIDNEIATLGWKSFTLWIHHDTVVGNRGLLEYFECAFDEYSSKLLPSFYTMINDQVMTPGFTKLATIPDSMQLFGTDQLLEIPCLSDVTALFSLIKTYIDFIEFRPGNAEDTDNQETKQTTNPTALEFYTSLSKSHVITFVHTVIEQFATSSRYVWRELTTPQKKLIISSMQIIRSVVMCSAKKTFFVFLPKWLKCLLSVFEQSCCSVVYNLALEISKKICNAGKIHPMTQCSSSSLPFNLYFNILRDYYSLTLE